MLLIPVTLEFFMLSAQTSAIKSSILILVPAKVPPPENSVVDLSVHVYLGWKAKNLCLGASGVDALGKHGHLGVTNAFHDALGGALNHHPAHDTRVVRAASLDLRCRFGI